MHLQQKSLSKVWKDQGFAYYYYTGDADSTNKHWMYDDGTEAYFLETYGFFVQKKKQYENKTQFGFKHNEKKWEVDGYVQRREREEKWYVLAKKIMTWKSGKVEISDELILIIGVMNEKYFFEIENKKLNLKVNWLILKIKTEQRNLFN